MAVLLIITTLGVLLLGYVMMDKIDKFFERGGFADSPCETPETSVLLYGDSELCRRLTEILKENKELYRIADIPAVGQAARFCVAAALSDDDGDNIYFCGQARRQNPGAYIIGVCNDRDYRQIFEKFGADRVFPGDAEPSEIFSAMEGRK